MTSPATDRAKKRAPRAPKLVVSADELAHIEALAEGAYQRNPALADRLLDEIGRARIVPAAKMPADVVTIGSQVTYRDESTGQEKTVMLVYPEHADISRGLISIMTPIGVSLIGLAEGAAFYWDTRDDQRKMLTVIAVAQPAEPAVPGASGTAPPAPT